MKYTQLLLVSICFLKITILLSMDGHMEGHQSIEVRPSYLVIKNETLWPISVIWTVAPSVMGSTIIKKYNTIVNAHGEEMLGTLSDVTTVSIYTYGQVWSKVSRTHHIPIDSLKQNPVLDGYVIIRESWNYSWLFDYQSIQRILYWHQSLPSDILSKLPGILRAKAERRAFKAHHILNIDPAIATEDMLENIFKRLVDRWQLRGSNAGTEERRFEEVLQSALRSLLKHDDRDFDPKDFPSQL